ncbi:flagellar protein FliT [Mesobacillus subterraneus]|uniref:flagellar protein FliT n=1 Tax=Mesobacillus subterraneus TaxID=285983 RepID=UPI001CFE9570|nr:flagellar protein FliT [Mesobacillus subterraneus]
MSAVNQFYVLTLELIQLLEKKAGERDDKIMQVEELLNQREVLLKELVRPYNPEEVELGEKLVHLNERFTKLLQAEKISIQKDIKDLQFKKESNTKYMNTYQNLATDGMFYDKRK